MCARFGIADHLDWVIFAVSSPQGQLPLNTELRPTDLIPGITEYRGERRSFLLPWGLHPEWSKRPVINARVETAASKPTFAREFAHQRCLVPCHSWYEWTGDKGQKQKHCFSRENGRQMAMAGLWFRRSERDPGGAVVILTQAATEQLRAYHDRMPLVLPDHCFADWLDESATAEQLVSLLNATTAEPFTILSM